MITLYEHPLSPYAQKVKISAREKGIALELKTPEGIGAGTSRGEFTAANPRAENRFGSIIRWNEADGDQASERFSWDIFVLAGPEHDSRDANGNPLTEDSIFAAPDGLAFDADRRLWIQCDISDGSLNAGVYTPFGNNQMLAANPDTGEIRRFLTGPVGCEITGVVTTPDRRTMFINVQHPGANGSEADFAAGRFSSNWPDGGNTMPRSATVALRRIDGGVIGA